MTDRKLQDVRSAIPLVTSVMDDIQRLQALGVSIYVSQNKDGSLNVRTLVEEGSVILVVANHGEDIDQSLLPTEEEE